MQFDATNRNCGEVNDKMPLGKGAYDALCYMEKLGREMGFKTRMLDGYSMWIEAGEGERMIAVLGHVDTVPVEKEGWVASPYDATLIDGKVYGRGICDDKGPTVLSLHAMKALSDAGKLKGKRVRLIVGADEESGQWVCMKRYRDTEETPECSFSPDGDYPATYAEKGIIHVTISGKCPTGLEISAGASYNIVPAAAKASIGGKTYQSEGKAAHASRPELGVNALRELCKKLAGDGIDHPFVRMVNQADYKGLNIELSDEPSGKLTFNPAIVEIKDGVYSLKCDIRMPVTLKPEDVVARIDASVKPLGFKAESDFFLAPLYVKKDSKLVTTLQEVYKDCTGRDDAPVAVGGGTYARTFPNAVAFGPLLPDEENTNHKTNERWDYKNMLLTYQIIANVIEKL